MRVFVLIAALALSACGTTPGMVANVPVNDDPTRDYDTDVFECRGEATAYAANSGLTGNGFMIQGRTNQCLKLRGWRYERG